MIVLTLSPDELRAIVREALSEALGQRPAAASRLLTKADVARELACSVATIDRMTRDGMPAVTVGRTRRFDVAACRAWLDGRSDRRTAPRDADDTDAGPVRLISRGVR